MAVGNVFCSLADVFVEAESKVRRVWDGVGATLAEHLGCAVMCTNGFMEDVLPSNLRLDGPLCSLLQGLSCRREALYLLKSSNITGKGIGFSLWFA